MSQSPSPESSRSSVPSSLVSALMELNLAFIRHCHLPSANGKRISAVVRFCVPSPSVLSTEYSLIDAEIFGKVNRVCPGTVLLLFLLSIAASGHHHQRSNCNQSKADCLNGSIINDPRVLSCTYSGIKKRNFPIISLLELRLSFVR